MKHIQHSTFRKRTIYTATVSGHVGHLRQAIAQTSGVSEGRRGSFNGHAGTNTTLTIEFERDDETLYEQLMENYRTICQQKKQERAQKVHPRFQSMMDALLPEGA